jgi:predicted ATPase
LRHVPSTRAPFPATDGAFVGRQAELRAVAAALARSRFVTLTGVGGTGKTRLAVEAAARIAPIYRDGAAFADFSGVHDPELVGSTLAHSLGWSPPSVAAAHATLLEALEDLDLLVVADNVEQLPGIGAALVAVLERAPRLRLLVTSRIALHAAGELRIPVPPLAVPAAGATRAELLAAESVSLFRQRARAQGVELDADADLAAVAAICDLLDGLPLAVELAASQLPAFTVQHLALVLQHRLDVLTCGSGSRPHRQRTLRAVMDWSYSLLPAHAAEFFDRIAVFAAPFDADAAAAVVAPTGRDDDAARLLAEISEHHLISSGPESARTFRMMNTVRDYAQQRLIESGELDAVRRRHLRYWRMHTTQLAAELAAARDVGGYRSALARLQQAFPEVLAALEFGVEAAPTDAEMLAAGLQLAVAAVPCWARGPSPADIGMQLLDELIRIDAGRVVPVEIRLAALVAGATLSCVTGGYRRAEQLASSAVAICKALEDDAGTGRALHSLGVTYLSVGDAAAAERVFHHELAAAQRGGPDYPIAEAHGMLAEALRAQGRYAAAAEAAWRGVRSLGRPADPARLADLVSTLGAVARDQGDRGRAYRLLSGALRLHHAMSAMPGAAVDLEALAATLSLDGAGSEAIVLAAAARRVRDRCAAPLPPAADHTLREALRGTLARAAPDEQAAAEERGWNTPLEDTVAHALRLARLAGRRHA